MEERCVVCGEIIPEGRQVCPICEGSGTYLKTKMTREELIELLEWILQDDKFGFGENWHEADEPIGEEEKAGWIIQATINYLKTHICVGN